jgi:hypothetical protein
VQDRRPRAAGRLLRLSFGFIEKMFPSFAVTLALPHDGIVEEISNNLIPSTAGRINEKNDSINMADITRTTYAHIETISCEKLNHVEIHSDERIYRTVTSIISMPLSLEERNNNAARVVKWYYNMAKDHSRRDIVRVKFSG